ncbi:MAG: hypothetical protein FWG51_01325 [Firmicutes bacterium]|nr:hypothetical protein [Bacillota bacterium]
MTVLEIILDIVHKYSIAILGLAFLVCGLTALVKRFLLKSYKLKKFLTFVPFILGTLVYALFLLIVGKMSEIIRLETLYSGFACGAVATTYYIVYEQFIRGKTRIDISDTKALAVMGILERTIIKKDLEAVSNDIYIILSSDNEEQYKSKEILNLIILNKKEDITEKEIKPLVKLILKLV